MKHRELKNTALTRSAVKAKYEALGPEFELLREMLRARTKAGLSQSDVAKRLGTRDYAAGVRVEQRQAFAVH